MTRASDPAPTFPRRVVLLGASNLTKSFPLVLRCLADGLPGPLEVFAAHGHGRSYGLWSRLFRRELPGLAQCRLWEALPPATDDAPPLHALLTDVGNDLLYGAAPETIAGWVAECVERLAERRATLIVTRLPLARVARLTDLQYRVARTILFPRSRLPWDELRARAEELDARLVDVADRRGARLVEPAGDWYGLDPIHVRSRSRPAAWRTIMSGWPGFVATDRPLRPTPLERRLARRGRACELIGGGRLVVVPQPVYASPDLTLALY